MIDTGGILRDVLRRCLDQLTATLDTWRNFLDHDSEMQEKLSAYPEFQELLNVTQPAEAPEEQLST